MSYYICVRCRSHYGQPIFRLNRPFNFVKAAPVQNRRDPQLLLHPLLGFGDAKNGGEGGTAVAEGVQRGACVGSECSVLCYCNFLHIGHPDSVVGWVSE